jgi:hypothetical protein
MPITTTNRRTEQCDPYTLAVLLELATQAAAGELTGLAYVAVLKGGEYLVNMTGTAACEGRMPRTRDMIDRLYQEAENMQASEPVFCA